jgi:hypothetical protein
LPYPQLLRLAGLRAWFPIDFLRLTNAFRWKLKTKTPSAVAEV